MSKNRITEKKIRNKSIRHYQNIALLLFLVVLFASILWRNTDNTIGLITPQTTGITPLQIRQIRDIGEWEFLSIDTEEMIDTVDNRFLNNKRLVRVYYGTMRLGVDMRKNKGKWIAMRGDTVLVKMPEIKLLDKNFIDETRTKSFFETGKWTNRDRKQLYSRAYSKMMKRCMTDENISAARRNAIAQMEMLIRAMGYKYVVVEF